MSVDKTVTLKFFHGGLFKEQKNGVVYLGGKIRTFEVDLDELCWFWLVDLAKKCGEGSYQKIEQVFYLVPGKNMNNGLRRVYSDTEVLEMTAFAKKNRCIDLYVLHGVDTPVVLPIDPAELQAALEKVHPPKTTTPPPPKTATSPPPKTTTSEPK
ncbi:hypothetical protein SOVF_179230 [Spinacia oleracea]|nr:hypothetical protein SOVF_179230 [Spinacia oleracea]